MAGVLRSGLNEKSLRSYPNRKSSASRTTDLKWKGIEWNGNLPAWTLQAFTRASHGLNWRSTSSRMRSSTFQLVGQCAWKYSNYKFMEELNCKHYTNYANHGSRSGQRRNGSNLADIGSDFGVTINSIDEGVVLQSRQLHRWRNSHNRC